MSQIQEKPKFLTVFKAYRPVGEVASAVENWLVEKAVIDKTTRAIRAQVVCEACPEPALVARVEGELVRIACDEPVRAPAAGQSAVLYDGERLLGGGFIMTI